MCDNKSYGYFVNNDTKNIKVCLSDYNIVIIEWDNNVVVLE